MARKRMQWKTLAPALRKLKKDELLHVLREAAAKFCPPILPVLLLSLSLRRMQAEWQRSSTRTLPTIRKNFSKPLEKLPTRHNDLP